MVSNNKKFLFISSLLFLASIVFGIAQQDLESANYSLQQADVLYKAARKQSSRYERTQYYRTCIQHYNRYRELAGPNQKDYQRAWYRSGKAQFMIGDIRGGETTFRAIIDTYQRGNYVGTSAWELGTYRYNKGQYGKAIPYIKKAEQFCENPVARRSALYMLARSLIKIDKIGQAEKPLRALANDKSPANSYRISAILALGHMKMQSGQTSKAIDYFQILIDTPIPENASIEEKRKMWGFLAEAQCYSGICLLTLGERDKGLELLNAAIKVPVSGTFQADALFTMMDLYYVEGNYQQVMEVFKLGPFLGNNSTLAKTFLLAGKAARKMGQLNDAITYFAKAEQTTNRRKIAFEAGYFLLKSAYQMRQTSLPEQAERFINKHKKYFGSHEWIQAVRVMSAETLWSMAATERAANVWKKVRLDKVNKKIHPQVLFKCGWCLVDGGDYNEAVAVLTDFLATYPNNELKYLAYAKRADAYLSMGDKVSALKDCERVLKDKTKGSLAAFTLQLSGRLYYYERKYAEMVKSFEKLMNDYSNIGSETLANAHYWLGSGLIELKKYDEAIQSLEKAKKISPTSYEERATLKILIACYRKKDASRMLQAIEALYKINPTKVLPPPILTWFGLEMRAGGDYKRADHYLTLATNPNHPKDTDLRVWRSLSKARLLSKKYQKALDIIDIILQSETTRLWKADAYLDKGEALLGLERYNEAELAAKKGLEFIPEGTIHARLQLILGHVDLARGDYKTAASSYIRAAEHFKDDDQVKPLALYMASLAYESMGNINTAKAFRERLQRELPKWAPPKELPVMPGAAKNKKNKQKNHKPKQDMH